MAKYIDLDEKEKVVFRKVRGRIVPIKVSLKQRAKEGFKTGIAPALVAAPLAEGLHQAAKNVKSSKGLFKISPSSFFTKAAGIRMGKTAGAALLFTTGYNMVMGARRKNVIKLSKKSPKPTKSKVFIAAKPAFDIDHPFGDHSFIYTRDKKGKVKRYGGQIKNPLKFGRKGGGAGVFQDFPTDKISRAETLIDITPDGQRDAERLVQRVSREAKILKNQLKAKDYQYRSIPIKKNRYNSNSVVGTITRRSGVNFRATDAHNLPGFNRSIPKERK